MWKGFLEMGLYLDMRVNMDSRDLKQLIHLSIYLESIYLSKKKTRCKVKLCIINFHKYCFIEQHFQNQSLTFSGITKLI